MSIVGRRTTGLFYLLHHYPWLTLALIVIVVAGLVWWRRRQR